MWETSGGQRGRQGYGMRETDIHTHRHWNYLASCVDPEPASCRRGGRVMESALTCTQVYKTEWPPAMTMKLLPRKAPPAPTPLLRRPAASSHPRGTRDEFEPACSSHYVSGLLMARHGLPMCRLPAYLKPLNGPVGWFLSHGTESSTHVWDIQGLSSSD